MSKEKINNKAVEKVALTADFGTLYLKRDFRGNYLRPVRASMTLHQKSGHLYYIAEKWTISATGYFFLNKVSSISLVTPKDVMVDGIRQPNPYVERDGDTKMIKTVNVRKLAIGYSPAGNIVVLDKSLYYNLHSYFLESVRAKMKRKKKNSTQPLYPDCAFIGIRDQRPNIDKSLVFLPVSDPLGLWINHENPAIVECIDQHIQRQRFGDRIAQKIVERNLLADHPAIAVKQVETEKKGDDRVSKVVIWGFRHELAPEEISGIAQQAEEGAKTIEIQSEEVKPEIEEEQATVNETVREEEGPATMDQPPLDWKGGNVRIREPGEEG